MTAVVAMKAARPIIAPGSREEICQHYFFTVGSWITSIHTFSTPTSAVRGHNEDLEWQPVPLKLLQALTLHNSIIIKNINLKYQNNQVRKI